jgi:hypothetical protein
VAKFVTIRNRVINLDQLQMAIFDETGKRPTLLLVFEKRRTFWNERGKTRPSSEVEEQATNMLFGGENARFIWSKLNSMSEKWELPDHAEFRDK